MTILDKWPDVTKIPRKSQIEALESIEKNIDKKNFVIQLPVGAGKSITGVTTSRFLSNGDGSSFIVTPQKLLQQQYEDTFPKKMLASLYGKNNYQCSEKGVNCELGAMIQPRCPNCCHTIARDHAMSNPNWVMNYKLALTYSLHHSDLLKKRELMIYDECHTLESHLTEFDSLSLSQKELEKYGVDWYSEIEPKKIYNWVITDVFTKISSFVISKQSYKEQLINELSKGQTTPDEDKELSELIKLTDFCSNIERFIDEVNPSTLTEEYVFIIDSGTIKIKRLFAKSPYNRFFAPLSNKSIFMSATILNQKMYCQDIGLDIKDTAFITTDSEFPKENRPVYYIPSMKMNASWKNNEREKDRNKMIFNIKKVIGFHPSHKGIIHTGTFDIARWIVKELQKDNKVKHMIFHHNPSDYDSVNRDDIINRYINCKSPAILISPSITEGLDLYDDLARFAIIAKIPYLTLSDDWIKTRMKLSNEWYQRQALIQVLQGSGRIVRSATDWGTTYILDELWSMLYNQTSQYIPQWWKDAYQQV